MEFKRDLSLDGLTAELYEHVDCANVNAKDCRRKKCPVLAPDSLSREGREQDAEMEDEGAMS